MRIPSRIRPSVNFRTCLFVSLLTCLFGCGPNTYTDYDLADKKFDSSALSFVTNLTGLPLPPASQGVRMYYKGNDFHPHLFAIIALPESGLSITNRLNAKQASTLAINRRFRLEVPWFIPNLTNAIFQFQYLEKDGMNFATICQENGKAILYLEHYYH